MYSRIVDAPVQICKEGARPFFDFRLAMSSVSQTDDNLRAPSTASTQDAQKHPTGAPSEVTAYHTWPTIGHTS